MSTAQFPKTFTAFQFEKVNGPLVKVEKSWKDPEENQVVVKILASGVCGSDTVVQLGFIGNPWPRVPGHEIVGDIVAVHPSVTEWKVGQRVGAPWRGGYCGHCQTCQAGVFTACAEGRTCTTGGFKDGGYSQYCLLDIKGICSLPADIEPVEIAPMMCAGVTVYKGMLMLNTQPGATVAVQGIGGLGHLAIQFYRAMGYRTIAISSGSAKKELSLKLGAHVYIDQSKQNVVEELKKLGGADVIASTIPSAQGAFDLLEGLAYSGKLLILGLTGETATLAPARLPPNQWSIHGYLCGTPKDCQDTVEFAKLHNIRSMVEVFPLDKAPEAYEHRYTARFRAVIVP